MHHGPWNSVFWTYGSSHHPGKVIEQVEKKYGKVSQFLTDHFQVTSSSTSQTSPRFRWLNPPPVLPGPRTPTAAEREMGPKATALSGRS